jgi:glucose/arabinose dehydrogenase
MKRILLVLLALSLTACLLTTPPPPTPVPASVVPDTAEPSTAVPPTTEPGTPLPPTNTPTSPPPDTTAFPNPDMYTWETVISGLERPVDLQHAGDERLFIIEKVGRIRILQNGVLIDFPYLDISDRVGSNGNEQGLLG